MSGTRSPTLTLEELPGEYAVSRLPAQTPTPPWATAGETGSFSSITRTADELSVVCAAIEVPDTVRSERGWTCFRVAGTLDFSEVGILASLARPLAEAGVSMFVVSTFDTDYLMVQSAARIQAIDLWTAAGHAVAGTTD